MTLPFGLNAADLDRHITGNYGEDQLVDAYDFEPNVEEGALPPELTDDDMEAWFDEAVRVTSDQAEAEDELFVGIMKAAENGEYEFVCLGVLVDEGENV